MLTKKYKTFHGWIGVIGIIVIMMIGSHYKVLKPLFKYHTAVGAINPSVLLLIAVFIYLIFRVYNVSKLNTLFLTLHSYIVTFVGTEFLTFMLMVFVMTETDAPYYPIVFIITNLLIYAFSTYFLLKKIFKKNFCKFVFINHVALTGVLVFTFIALING